jgi:dTDP-4-amino-4,6-dideoxygalactose transaminase
VEKQNSEIIMIPVTKTFLPLQDEYQAILKLAWDNGWITNRGILVNELETKLKDYLKVKFMLATTNGTLPIQIAIKALKLSGEIITTPFSYVATTSSIVWEGCTPVFVDIHPEYLTIDESKIEAAITPKTTGILTTHVFGNPCDVVAIQAIAKRNQLKVIYDASHCFGVNYMGQSIFNYGDISTCSFHATKVFHTGEGGALFTHNSTLFDVLFYHHNFGHKTQESFKGKGINGKMSELQAAMGLAILPYMNKLFQQREKVVFIYNEAFEHATLQTLKIRPNTQWNYSYYPVVFKDEAQLLRVKLRLNEENIFPRRYFYPSLNTLPYVKDIVCHISESIASRILCLPLYPDLELKDQEHIIKIIKLEL